MQQTRSAFARTVAGSLGILVTGALAAAVVSLAPPVAHAQPASDFVPVTDEMLQDPAPGDWLMWRRTLDGWGYSPLDQIDRDNVGELRMVWSRALTDGRQQGTPLAYGGVLYMPNPADVIQAIDAVTGDLVWEHRREVPDDIDEYVFNNLWQNNRNIAIYGSLIIDTSVDDHIFALDAATGRMAWETQILNYRENPAMQSSGPIVADGKVISGRSCMPAAGPDGCVITAHDPQTGEELWRRRTIPGPGEPGDETWGGVPFEDRKHVGAWMVPSYDPELNLVYVGTSVTSPAPKFLIGGTDNQHLYHNSTLALDADTGEIVWYYQHLNDHWDLDHPFERLLVDTAVAPDAGAVDWINPRVQPGEVRKVITGIPGKTGVVYTLDRETGEFLWATPTITQNVISHIDGASGAVTENPELVFTGAGQGGADLPPRQRRQGLGGGRLQPPHQHHVLPAAQRLRAHDVRGPREHLGLRHRLAPRDRPGHRPGRHRLGHLGRDRRDRLDSRAALGHHVPGRHRGRPRLRRRRQRPLPRPRPGDRRGALGDQPWLGRQRLPDHLRRRRPAVRGGQHRHPAVPQPDPRGERQQPGQQPVRVRVAGVIHRSRNGGRGPCSRRACLLVREDAVGGHEASEFDSLLDPGSVLCEGTRSERRKRKHTERRANEFTPYHVCVRRHGLS